MHGDRHRLDDSTEEILERIFEGQMFWAAWLGEHLTREMWKSEERIMTQVGNEFDQETDDVIAAINEAGDELQALSDKLDAFEAAQANQPNPADVGELRDAVTGLRAKITAIATAHGDSGGGTTTPPDDGTGDGGTTEPPAGETPLDGDTKVQAEAAALAADGVPEGATVIRSEVDSVSGLPEVHLLYPDGSQATVELAADFSVTSVTAGDQDATPTS